MLYIHWLLITLLLAFSALAQAGTLSSSLSHPQVIAHRGASGYLPEHTLEAVTLAYIQGADFIEQDVVLSKDGVPIILHDIHLDTTTDVALKFPTRKREDNRFYAIDFTLQELKTLRVFERINKQNEQVYPNRYQGNTPFTLATLEEEIELIQQLNRQFKKQVGWYVEIKSPRWHQEQGQDISAITLKLLRSHGLDKADIPIYVQCFDFAETQRLRNTLKAKLKLVQLIAENEWQESVTDYDYLKTEQGLKDIAKVAQGIGPWIPQLLHRSPANQQLVSTGYAELAHAQGLVIHPYTYRIDDLVLQSTQTELLDALFNTVKVNGIFSDFPDVVKQFLDAR